MRFISGLVNAFAAFSCIPVPESAKSGWSGESRRYILCFFPLVGIVVGLAIWGWLFLCGKLGLSPFLKGAVAAALPVILTNGIHMDGFLDTSDALASWQSPEKRLEILKDSHIGSGAAMACGIYLLLFAAVLGEMENGSAAMTAPCFVASRAMSAWTSIALKGARPGGMLHGFTDSAPKKAVAVSSFTALTACAAIWIAFSGWKGLLPLLALGCCVIIYRRMAYKAFGGVTGDLAGWFVEVSELGMLAAIAAAWKI